VGVIVGVDVAVAVLVGVGVDVSVGVGVLVGVAVFVGVWVAVGVAVGVGVSVGVGVAVFVGVGVGVGGASPPRLGCIWCCRFWGCVAGRLGEQTYPCLLSPSGGQHQTVRWVKPLRHRARSLLGP